MRFKWKCPTTAPQAIKANAVVEFQDCLAEKTACSQTWHRGFLIPLGASAQPANTYSTIKQCCGVAQWANQCWINDG